MALSDLINLDPLALASIALRTIVVYLVLLGLLRAAGKRELGQMTPFDLVVLLVISNAVQNAMVGPDSSLTGGLLAAAVLVLANWIVDRLAVRARWVRRYVIGSPTLLVQDGTFVSTNLQHEGILQDEVLQAIREHGVDKVADVKKAVLEVDGTISVVPGEKASSRTRRRVRGRKPAG